MDITTAITTYLLVHGLSTIGAIIIFLIRNEHRVTKLETSFNNLKETHDRLTGHGIIGH
jgi:hypothetical protein